MKKLLCAGVALGMVLTGCSQSTSKSKKDMKIGVIQYMQHDALDAAYKGFKAYLVKQGYSAKNITYKNASGDASNSDTIADQLVNAKPDLIYAIATPAAQAVAKKTKDIPIVVSAVTDPADSKLVKSNKKPGTNVTGTSDLTPVNEQMQLLTQLMPKAKTVAVMYTGSESNSEIQADMAVKAAKKYKLTPSRKTVSDSNDIQSVAQSIKTDACYITTDNLLAANIPAVTQSLDEAKIPLIVGEENMVKHGGLATYGVDYTTLGTMSGKMADQILSKGKKPASMPIQYEKASDCVLTINKDKVKQFNIKVPSSLNKQAKYVTTSK
jgi:putative ABC transport system substrate-binding protein